MTLADVLSTCTKSALTLAMDGAKLFLDGDLVKAVSSGWTTEQVFGVHRSAPFKRFDCMGLLLALVDGSDLTGITPDVAHFSGGQRMRREFIFTHEQRLLWELNSKIKKEY